MRRPGWAVVLLVALVCSAATAITVTQLVRGPDAEPLLDPSEALKDRVAQLEAENEALRAGRDGVFRSFPEGPSVRRRVAVERSEERASRSRATELSRLKAIADAEGAQPDTGDPMLLAQRRHAILRLDPDLSQAQLEELLRDPETDTGKRARAFAALHRHDPAAALALAEQLIWDANLSIDARSAVVQALGSTVAPGAVVPASLRTLATEPGSDWQLRKPALAALVVADPMSAIPYVEGLATSDDPETLERGVDILLSARDRAYLPLLTRTINRPEVRRHAARLVNTIASLKDKNWSAVQMTGEPDLPIAGDLGTAWASKRPDMGEVWVELTYELAVVPSQIRLHETLNPGALARVEARRPTGDWERVWVGSAAEEEAPRWFEPLLDRVDFETHVIRVVFDTNRVNGWNEIDAIELIGTSGRRQWVKSARASSSYSD